MPKAAIDRTSPSTFMNFRPAIGLGGLSLSRRTVGSSLSLSDHSGEKKTQDQVFPIASMPCPLRAQVTNNALSEAATTQ